MVFKGNVSFFGASDKIRQVTAGTMLNDDDTYNGKWLFIPETCLVIADIAVLVAIIYLMVYVCPVRQIFEDSEQLLSNERNATDIDRNGREDTNEN